MRKPMNRRFGRRGFLASLGVSAAAAPFIPLLSSHAEGEGAPKRLVLVFSPNGTIHENWVPQGSEHDWNLSTILSPLAAFKDDLVVVDGLKIQSDGPGDAHQRGMASLWSGSKILSGNDFEGGNGEKVGWGGGQTIDQHVANAIGNDTAFKSLEFAAQPGGNNIWTRMCYSGSNAPIPPEGDPQKMFDRLFEDFDTDAEEYERIKARRGSVIDAVRGDLQSIETKISSEDKLKVEKHLDAVDALEQRLDSPPWGEACVPPEVPGTNYDANENFPQCVDMQTELLVMGLACGLTNVASLQWNRSVGGVRFNWLGINDGHHSISHLGNNDQTAVNNLTDINTWYAQRFADLIGRMKDTPDPLGEGSLLDNSLVVWGNELARGNSHSRDPIPFVLAGKAGGAIETGRFLQFDNMRHNQLLVSIAQAMGLNTNAFGDMDDGGGALPGLVG